MVVQRARRSGVPVLTSLCFADDERLWKWFSHYTFRTAMQGPRALARSLCRRGIDEDSAQIELSSARNFYLSTNY